LEFERRVGGGVGQSELNADIQRKFHRRSLGGLVVVIAALLLALALGLVVIAAGIVEQGRTEAVILVVERAGVGEILDLAEHLDAEAPMLGEVVFGAPAIFEAEPIARLVIADLVGEHGIERD